MYNVIKSAISAGNHKLADIQHKIKKMYVLGDLTEAQMEELLALASLGASPDAERPEVLQLIQTLSAKIDAIDGRVKALEGDSGTEDTQPEQPAYPEWKPWDGISQDYQQGAVVAHNGQLWESIFAGQNVWEPGAVGTNDLWVKCTPEE